MGSLAQAINNEFSARVIDLLNARLENISTLVSAYMEPEAYEEIGDEVTDRLVEASKDFFIQGFLRGMAAAKSGMI
ncbi:MAG: hypothetical protein HFH38_01605 [Lachnospiraceae bacterium]|jgi:hypothetical protein|nr:hypothetical protein [Lachnospiraceae bacterium]